MPQGDDAGDAFACLRLPEASPPPGLPLPAGFDLPICEDLTRQVAHSGRRLSHDKLLLRSISSFQ
jgi:hypothetical protein